MNIFKLYFIFHIYYLIFEFIYALEYPKVSFNILDLLEFIMYLKISDHFLHSSNFQNYFSNVLTDDDTLSLFFFSIKIKIYFSFYFSF